MPAFSYKERFIPFIQDGSKSQTIRAFRKYLVEPGQVLSHFYGMRTKHCTRIIENTPCTEVKTIFIMESGSVYLAPVMEKETALGVLAALGGIAHVNIAHIKKHGALRVQLLDDASADLLAWQDGFRMREFYYQSFVDGRRHFENHQLMLKWWNQTHNLPFTGQLIKWDPAAVKPISITKKPKPCRSIK
jgi:hypothetical protein